MSILVLCPAICDNMDETRGHYAKWNKPDTQRQILYEITMESNKVTVAENRMVLAKGLSERNEEVLIKGYLTFSYKILGT